MLRSDGLMCCLGFDAIRRGLTEDQIKGADSPEDLVDREVDFDFSAYADLLTGQAGQRVNNSTCYQLMEINDDDGITEAEREAELADLFSEIGIEVSFVSTEGQTTETR